jgi:hypothetical protein
MATFNPTADVTGTTAAVYRPNIWTANILKARESNLVLVPLVAHYDRDVQNKGQAVIIPNMANLAANQKAANTPVTLQANTETSTTLTIDQHWESSIMIEDFADIQAAYDLAAGYTEKAGYALAEKMDNYVATAMTSGFSNTVGTYGTALTYANLLSAKLILDQNKVPLTERYIVVTPKGQTDLLQIDQFTRYDAMGAAANPSPFEVGKVGTILGFPVYMSQNLVVTAGTPVQNNSLMFHKEAYAIAVQKDVSIERQRKTEFLADLIVASALWGGILLRANHGVLLKS